MSTTPPPPPALPPDQQPMSDSDARLWAMLGQLGGIILGFIAPLIVMLVFGPRNAFVKKESTEALNFQITVLIGYLVSFVLMFVFIGSRDFKNSFLCKAQKVPASAMAKRALTS